MNLKAKLSSPAKRTPFTFEVDREAVTVELVEISAARKAQVAELAGGTDEAGNVRDMGRFTAALMAHCTYEPGTTRRIWSDKEIDLVLEAGPKLDPLAEACLKLVREAATEPAKKSEPEAGTAPASS